MPDPWRNPLLVALIVGLVLAAMGYPIAISATGPYGEMIEVKIGAFIGPLFAYVLAAFLVVVSARRLRQLKSRIAYRTLLLLGAFASSALVLSSPLISLLALEIGC